MINIFRKVSLTSMVLLSHELQLLPSFVPQANWIKAIKWLHSEQPYNTLVSMLPHMRGSGWRLDWTHCCWRVHSKYAVSQSYVWSKWALSPSPTIPRTSNLFITSPMSGIFMKSKGTLREVHGAQVEEARLQGGVSRPVVGSKEVSAGCEP